MESFYFKKKKNYLVNASHHLGDKGMYGCNITFLGALTKKKLQTVNKLSV